MKALSLYVLSAVLFAKPLLADVADEMSVEEAMTSLREIATKAADGDTSIDIKLDMPKLVKWMDNIVPSGPHHSWLPPNFSQDFYLAAFSRPVILPKVDCRNVYQRFLRTKYYWQQMLQISRYISYYADRECTKCLDDLILQAKKVKFYLDETYPKKFDEKNLIYTRRWDISYTGYGDLWLMHPDRSMLTVKEFKGFTLSDFTMMKIRWRGLEWGESNLPEELELLWDAKGLTLKRTLSTTEFCLEPQGVQVLGVMRGSSTQEAEGLETFAVIAFP
jgi:hypothetical protein